MALARMKPAPAKVVQSKSDNGSGVAVAGVPEVDDEEEDDDEDEDEDEDELVESRVIDTPGVCDTSWGGSLALVTLSEKFKRRRPRALGRRSSGRVPAAGCHSGPSCSKGSQNASATKALRARHDCQRALRGRARRGDDATSGVDQCHHLRRCDV